MKIFQISWKIKFLPAYELFDWLFLHKPFMCSSKVSFLSIFILESFSLYVRESFSSLPNKFIGFTFIQLLWNHKKGFPLHSQFH